MESKCDTCYFKWKFDENSCSCSNCIHNPNPRVDNYVPNEKELNK